MVNTDSMQTTAIAAIIIVFWANDAFGKKLYFIVVFIVSGTYVVLIIAGVFILSLNLFII